MSIRKNGKIIAGTSTCTTNLLDWKWADHEINDASWLRADTFSWQPAGTYFNAYNELCSDIGTLIYQFYWSGTANFYTRTGSPVTGDPIYNQNGAQIDTVERVADGRVYPTLGGGTYGERDISGDTSSMVISKTLQSETIAGTTVYFYLGNSGRKICPAAQENNVATVYAATGVAWYYILDNGNNAFKLPRTQFGVVGLRDVVGKYVEPGLPNITGMISMINPAPNDYRSRFTAGSGALKGTGTLSAGRSPSTSETGNGYPNASLDASWSNSIYGNSTTVQAPATQMYLYFYVGEYTQSAIENTAGLNASLFNGKADIDLSNAAANASAAAKETIVGWGTPDYSAGVGFSSGVDYQAPSDGFVIASGWTSTSTNSSFYLNGTRMASFVASNGVWLPGIVYCPVHKGDTINITFTQGTYTMNFYPLKGV